LRSLGTIEKTQPSIGLRQSEGKVEDTIVYIDTVSSSDGQEGRPAFVAYQGKVYDVSESRLWRGGVHARRHQAGRDLTADLAAAPHDASVFGRVPLVGILATEAEQPRGRWDALLDWYFDLHPHPVTLHFPIALGVVASAFLILYLLTDSGTFEASAYYVLWAALVTSPVAILTGASSWWFNYGHVLNRRFRAKLGASVVLLIMEAVALALRATNPTALVDREPVGWAYATLLVATAPLVLLLGWVGGKIAFPSVMRRPPSSGVR
jgi:predicted heme/steroid binding protein/uncharacterized membrane protein